MVVKLKLKFVRSGGGSRERERRIEEKIERRSLGKRRKTKVLREKILRKSIS